MRPSVRTRKCQERGRRPHSAFAAVAVLLGVLVMGLGGIRLYNICLEQRLTRLNETIENYQEIELDLRNNMASLLSPSRVYSVASAKMGMQNGASVAVVTVPASISAHVAVASRPEKGRKSLVAGLNLAGFFQKEAHAQD
jgi:hypothetical protein